MIQYTDSTEGILSTALNDLFVLKLKVPSHTHDDGTYLVNVSKIASAIYKLRAQGGRKLETSKTSITR